MTVIVSLVIGLLSGMGVGSGGLLVIYLTLVEEMPQLTAQGANLLFFTFASASSLLVHLLKRKFFILAVFIMGLAGTIGAILGSRIASLLPALLLRKIFGGMLVVSGIFSLKRQKKPKKL